MAPAQMPLKVVVCLLVLGLGVSCGPPPTLTRVQKEVFVASCTFSTCHKGPNDSGAGGLNLEGATYRKLVGVAATGVSGKVLVVAGKPDESYLVHKVIDASPTVGGRMPPNADPLTSEQLDLLRGWISAGAKDD